MDFYDDDAHFVVLKAGLCWRAVGASSTLRGAKCIARRIFNADPFTDHHLYVFAREDLDICIDSDCFFVPKIDVRRYWRLSDFDGKWKKI